MSQTDYPKSAHMALDRYDVPPLSLGFVDRVLGSAAAAPALPSRTAPRRSRRGLWLRTGQAAIGVAALGMMSAAAVASGLLGAVGIEVPVLTAMLAPAPVKPAPEKKKPTRLAAKPKSAPPATAIPAPAPAAVAEPDLQPWQQARLARRAANEARRNAFLDAHRGLREAIAAGPEARRVYFAQHPEVWAELQARRAEVQARRAAMIERQRARRAARAASPDRAQIDPALMDSAPIDQTRRAAIAKRRQARLAEFRALDPEARAKKIEEIRARRAARRAMRAAGETGGPTTDEGSVAPVR